MSDDLIEWFKEADGFSQGTKAPHKWVLQAEQEITALRVRLEDVEKERDHWKHNCQSNAAAMNNVEEALGQILPVGVRAGSERGPEPVEWAEDMISALHKVKALLAEVEKERSNFYIKWRNALRLLDEAEAALATARRDALEEAAKLVEGEGHNPNLRRIAAAIRALAAFDKGDKTGE